MTRRVLVTGAARGIGAAIAARFAKAGLEVLAPTRRELDLASTDSVKAYIAAGGGVGIDVDVLVNNAGENKLSSLGEMALEDWQRTLTVNLTGAMLLIQASAPRMAARRWGRIVNVSSVYGALARPARAAYSASKAGLEALTRAAALEWGEHDVLANALCPGFVDTELTRRNNPPEVIAALCRQTALKRLARPEELAEAAFFVGSEANTYMTGQTLVVDGGFSIQ